MAEGGNFSRSLKHGSDIVFECTTCAADGSRLEALQFCQTFDQFLCDTCTKYHQRFTKSHRLAPAGSTKYPIVQTSSKNKLVAAKCHFHPERDIEMYCGTHDMVYCLLCIAMEHRSCNNVEEIKDGVHKPNTAKLQLLVASMDHVNGELHKTKRDNFNNLKLVKKKKADLLKEIDKLRTEMNDHLDHLERKIKAELDEEFTKLEQAIRDDITTADYLLTITNERKPDLACNNGDKNMFIAEILGQNAVLYANAFLVKVNQSKPESVTFERNTHVYDCIKGADHVGRIVRTRSIQKPTKRSKYIIKSSNQANVNVSTDKSTCCIVGMCQLQDGTILIADYRNSKLKMLDDQLNVMDFCNLTSKPLGLCSISSNEVVVRYTQSMQFMHVVKSPGKLIHVKRRDICFGNTITFCEENLWTLDEKGILVYTTSGDLVKKIDSDSQGQKIFSESYPRSIAVSNDGTEVYVTAWEDRVVAFNKNGDVLRELRDQQLKETRGICITEDDIVLVAGWLSKNVVMFDRDGNSLGELVTCKDMLSNPWTLWYDRKKCRLLVGYTADKIQIYELTEQLS